LGYIQGLLDAELQVRGTAYALDGIPGKRRFALLREVIGEEARSKRLADDPLAKRRNQVIGPRLSVLHPKHGVEAARFGRNAPARTIPIGASVEILVRSDVQCAAGRWSKAARTLD